MFDDFGQDAVPFGGLGDQRIDLGWGCAEGSRAVDAGFEGSAWRRLGQDCDRVEVEGHGNDGILIS